MWQSATTATKAAVERSVPSSSTQPAVGNRSPATAATSTTTTTTTTASGKGYASYESGASTPQDFPNSDEDSSKGSSSSRNNASKHGGKPNNPKSLSHSTSAIGLDEMIEDRRSDGDLRQNVVHIEVPFGKPIEEVYEGVHSGPVLGSGISGLVRLVTHKATGIKYAVKVLDLGLVDTSEGLTQLREEIFIMCQVNTFLLWQHCIATTLPVLP